MKGRYDQAVTKLKEAVTADPLVTDQALLSDEAKQGMVAFRKGDVRCRNRVAGRGIETLSAVGRSPSHPRHGSGGGEVHDGSLASLREAARMNPRDERSRIAIADVLVASGKPDAARESLRETIREIP